MVRAPSTGISSVHRESFVHFSYGVRLPFVTNLVFARMLLSKTAAGGNSQPGSVSPHSRRHERVSIGEDRCAPLWLLPSRHANLLAPCAIQGAAIWPR